MSELILPVTTVPDPMTAPGLRWGVLGPGRIASKFVGTMHAATTSRLVAVCSRSEQRAAAFAADHEADGARARAYGSIEDFLADGEIDAVYVASPHAQHAALALPIIEAGIPVVVEKAFTLNAPQAIKLFEAAQKSGSFVMEAMWSRFLPHYDVIRQVIDSGLIGEVTSVRADHGQYFPFDAAHRLYDPALGGGALLDLGVYPVSFAHWVAGALTDVSAVGSLTSTGVDDTVAMIGTGSTPSHPAVSVTTTLSARTANNATVVGREGRIDVEQRFYVPTRVTVTRFSKARYGTDTTAVFDSATDLPYALPEAPEGQNYGMAFEIAEASRRISAGDTESPLMRWQDTLEVLQLLDEIRAQVGVVYPSER
ncbi:MAG: Gfo/Idh/MocA family oxidoreductase [Dermabacter sp.]|nr:Gfo/Idh/MocA family oxidoreductase [Dermabacter sp.]